MDGDVLWLTACEKDRCFWENVLIFMYIMAIPQPLLEAVGSLQVAHSKNCGEIVTPI